jgi:DNA-binding transcriptional regulator LsrR (DeoR family)
MHYLEEMTQSEIAKKNYVERSMVSRMLTEVSNQGIIEFCFINSTQTARALGNNKNIKKTLTIARQSDVILMVIGNTESLFSRGYNPRYIPYLEIDLLLSAKVDCDNCGLFIDIHVNPDGFILHD